MDGPGTLARVREMVGSVLACASGSLGDDDRLVEAGLDSVGMVDLLALVEERFGLAVPNEEITPENFASVRAVAALIDRLSTS